jgi:ATP-dependent DNA helicase RecQ
MHAKDKHAPETPAGAADDRASPRPAPVPTSAPGAASLYDEAVAGLRAFLDTPEALFREGQWEAIRSLVDPDLGAGRQLVVQRTGWGKSIVYFLATRMLRDRGRGATLIISPLLSLMRNQIAMAERFGLRACTINSANTDVWEAAREALLRDEVDVLLVSPERLANQGFLESTLIPIADRIGLFVVDEAHCISDWGHDFRPDYQRIRSILRNMPPTVPVLATTATANDRVVADVSAQLGPDARMPQRGPLARPSLCLETLTLPSRVERYAWLADKIPRLPGSGIVYVLTRRDAHHLTAWLCSQGIQAEAYMGAAGMREGEGVSNEELERRLLDNELKVLVATTALGMGFDKPDLAFVLHFQRPASVIHYYQQVGRAGRALESAYGVLLGGSEDEEITGFFIDAAFPPAAHVSLLLRALERAPKGLTFTQLEREVNLGRMQIEKVVKLLAVDTPAPITQLAGRWRRTPVPYALDTERIARLTQLRRHEQERMRDYLSHDACLMAFLQEELSDASENIVPCGRCAPCRGASLLPGEPAAALQEAAAAFLRHGDRIVEPRASWNPVRGALYEDHGWRGHIPLELQAEPGWAMSHWSDPGLAEQVRRARQDLSGRARFDQVAVDALVSFVTQRWHAAPAFGWVTAAPSLRRPELVRDLAARVAAALGLPFHPVIEKLCETRPQRELANSHYQAQNLSGAFVVQEAKATHQVGAALGRPVLLIDDVVDSRWTLTVLSALLREAGSGPVYPLVLSAAGRM